MEKNDLSKIDVVILCGGLGTRIRSEIGEQQKTMAQIGERPFLDILLKHLSDQGFKRIILCTGYQSSEVQEYYKENDWGLDILFSEEKEPLGTGGAIKNTRELVQGDIFIGLNGDCFCPLDYKSFVEFHIDKKSWATLVVSQVEEGKDFGSIELGESDRIIRFAEKSYTPSNFLSAGIYCFNKDVFSAMPDQKKFSIEVDFFQKILDKDFFGFKTSLKFIDIGTPDRYEEAKKKLREVI